VHCTQTVESADVKVQHIFHGKNKIRCNTNCKYRTYSYILLNNLHKRKKTNIIIIIMTKIIIIIIIIIQD